MKLQPQRNQSSTMVAKDELIKIDKSNSTLSFPPQYEEFCRNSHVCFRELLPVLTVLEQIESTDVIKIHPEQDYPARGFH